VNSLRTRLRGLGAAIAVVAIVAGCSSAGGSPSASASVAPPATASPAASAPASGAPSGSSAAQSGLSTALTVGLGYIPSVQFAQFYLADQKGYYRDAGLTVTFQNKIDPDLVTLVGQGAVDIGLADGTSVIPAGSQGIPIRYVATIYAQDPNVVIAKAGSGIASAADLKGKKLGIPGKYGSSWVMLQALLKGAILTPDDLQILLYPDFGQAVALQQGAIDAATGFANNEPIQLANAGVQTTVLRPAPDAAMPGPGLIASTKTIDSKRAALIAFVAATLHAMRDIEANPDAGVDATIAVVPTLGSDRATQLKVLQATVAMWESDFTKAHGEAALDTDGWTRSIAFLSSIGLVANPVTAGQLLDSSLLPK
jgi:NitT/TauT family transport system substrate-binding protein